MIKEIFLCIIGGFKYLKTSINRHFKEDYEDFIKWFTTYD